MLIEFSETADNDLKPYIKSGNKTLYKKVFELINAIEQNPFEGIGKPEPLKHHLSGKWSMRINKEHRIVYQVTENSIFLLSVKGHYL